MKFRTKCSRKRKGFCTKINGDVNNVNREEGEKEEETAPPRCRGQNTDDTVKENNFCHVKYTQIIRTNNWIQDH